MPAPLEWLGQLPQRVDVIRECVDLIDARVKLKGFMVRGAYATIKALKPGVVLEVVDSLLDDWLAKFQHHHDVWAESKRGTFSEHLIDRAGEVAGDLLAVTDARAAKTTRATAKKLYARLRDSAKTNVVEALPELSRLIERYLAPSRHLASA